MKTRLLSTVAMLTLLSASALAQTEAGSIYGEARMITDEAGKRSWQWITASAPPLAQTADVH